MYKTITLFILLLVPFLLIGQCFEKLGGGESNIIAQKSDGTLWFWGWGANGQSGTGNGNNHLTPVLFANLNQAWTSFNAGFFNTIGIDTNGSLWGTGANDLGQLGVGTTVLGYFSPLQISPGTTWKNVSSTAHTLAIQTNGTLWGWGQNNNGQMGNGTCCNNQISPIQIGTATDWKQVESSLSGASLALKENGTLWGWGGNSTRLVSVPSTLVVNVPTQIGTANDWEYISVGSSHCMGLKMDGTLWTWGGNPPANGTGSSSNVPQQVGSDTWQFIDAGRQFSLGIKSDGTLWAWGQNNFGQLGDGTTTTRSAPIQIGTDTNWVAVAGGGSHTVALKTDGSLWAWGRNVYGQYGNGTTTQSLVPVYVPVEGCVLSVSDFQQIPLVLSPNPTQDRVTLSFKRGLSAVTIAVYDVQGRLVMQPQEVEGLSTFDLSLGRLTTGLYVVKVMEEGRVIGTQKVVRE